MSLIYRRRHQFLLKLLPQVALDRIIWHFIRSRVAKAGCWFIAIPSTSSKAIGQELSQEFGWPFKSGIVEDYHYFLPEIIHHRTAQDMRMCLEPLLWQKIFTFSVIRNPWDRYLSLFFVYFKLGSSSPIQHDPDKLGPIFKRWLTQVLPRIPTPISAEAYLLDEDGNMMVDFVARYENRQADLAYIGETINCPQLRREQKVAEFIPGVCHYSEYYDSELRDFVAEIAKWEIANFNYSFEHKQ